MPLFLRSIGIPATDGAPTFDERREHWQNKVRNAVLDALDELAPKLGAHPGGWKDEDLPALFPMLDKHARTLFDRHDMMVKHDKLTDPRIT